MKEVTHQKVEEIDVKFIVLPNSTGSLPARFGIVTAFSKNGSPLSNWQADRSLFAALQELPGPFFRIIAFDKNKMATPSFGVMCQNASEIADIAKRFSQDSFYFVTGGALRIYDARLRAFDEVGSFHERVI